MELFIFTLSDCIHCQDLKTRLGNVKLSFKEFEINKNKSFWEEIVKQTGEDIVPTVYIKEDEGKKTHIFIPGKDFNNGDEAINIIKKYTL